MFRHQKTRYLGRRVWVAMTIVLFTAAAVAAQTTYEVVHRFRNSEGTARSGGASQSRLILAPDGNFYGTTYWGGTSGFGTVYRMSPAGTVTTLRGFAYADGANPAAGLVRSSDGDFYGTTSLGGPHNHGTVFRMGASGVVTGLHSFDGTDGHEPLASLIQASDGKFYGTTSAGGANGVGVVFRIDSSGAFELLHSFDRYVNGARPVAELVEARGAFYGTTREGGENNQGTVFRVDLAGSVTSIHAFAGPDGQYPVAALISSASGDLYGTTSYSGVWGPGLIYRIDMADQVTTLHSFNSETEGAILLAPLVQASDGDFYGTASGGGVMSPVRYGTVFRVTDTGTLTVLHAFDGTDGIAPATSLVQTSDGSFYGLTNSAYSLGLPFGGTVFRIDSSSGFTTLHRFGWQDGTGPASLLGASDGLVYGTTSRGGTSNHGTVFRMDPYGDVTELHSLEGGLDGVGPAHLVEANDGKIYGTDYGGANNLGRIFRLDPSGATTTLHSFDGADGAGSSGLVQADDGKLYGTTPGGGAGYGTFFRIDTSGNFESLDIFHPDYNGAYPNGPLVAGSGHFYGTTQEGGAFGMGCVFDASPGGVISPTYSFAYGGSEGVWPLAPLADSDDGLWGTTSAAAEGAGTVFKTIGGSYNLDTLHVFDGAVEGGSPQAALLAPGYLYGTTSNGGPAGKGTIFQMDNSGNLTVLYSFPGQMDGGNPVTPLILASDGFFYGTAGVIYRLSDNTVAINQIMPTSGPPAGGAGLIVIGGGFIEGTAVTVGGTTGTDLLVVDSTFLSLFTPPLSPGTLNDVSVTNPGSVPATATRPNAFFADFLDVPQIDPFHNYVEKIVREGITAGCGGGNYCPQDSVTRAQMAAFLLKSEHGSAYIPPPCTGVFADVPCPSMFADWIEQLAAEGITAGCGGGNYCPASPVTRAQMAVFLLKTKHGPAFDPPDCAGIFADVPCPSLFADWIEQLAAEEITGGCGGGNYCPANPNTRAQMSAFLVKTFGM